jgi:UDP-glucose 4-epimerase
MSGHETVLVTGGAGYIGSHMVLALLDAGHQPIILDDFSTGHEQLLPIGVPVFRGNVADTALVTEIFNSYGIDAVVHFAASIVVSESVTDPLKYYLNNTASTSNFIAACVQAGIKRFVFSSTAAVYGNQDCNPIVEDASTEPENPYGTSKLMSETILRDCAQATGISYVILRYFNVAGADPHGRAGQLSEPATHLIKIAVEAAVGKRASIQVYGTDYPTPDGTCIRDYIHVSDLIGAHMAALDHLQAGGKSMLANCGYGHGASVRDVLDVVVTLAGKKLVITDAPRRLGDAAILVADSTKLRTALGWTPKHDDLQKIVSDALAWERSNS